MRAGKCVMKKVNIQTMNSFTVKSNLNLCHLSGYLKLKFILRECKKFNNTFNIKNEKPFT